MNTSLVALTLLGVSAEYSLPAHTVQMVNLQAGDDTEAALREEIKKLTSKLALLGGQGLQIDKLNHGAGASLELKGTNTMGEVTTDLGSEIVLEDDEEGAGTTKRVPRSADRSAAEVTRMVFGLEKCLEWIGELELGDVKKVIEIRGFL